MDKVLEIYEKAKKLLNEIEVLRAKIGSQKSHNFFLKWVEQEYPNDLIGLSFENIKTIRRYLKEGIYEEHESTLKADTYIFEKERKIKRGIRYTVLAKQYVDEKKEIELELSNTKFWYLYFLTIGAIEKNYPKLGRGVLKMREGQVKLKIPDENPVNDYYGNYEQINSHIGFFDLDTLENDENDKQRLIKKLHIKINFGTLDDEIIIGSYNTYDKRIYTGALILERIKNKTLYSDTKKLNKKVKFLSNKENRVEFIEDVDKSIRAYLSSKLKNIRQAPSGIVQNTEGLKLFLSNNRKKTPSKEDIENRFLELDHPIVFISSPQSSIDENVHSEELVNFINEIPEKIRKEFKNFDVHTEGSFTEDPAETLPSKTIEYLERTRYFILLLPKTATLSYSVIQLGWALKSSKNILLIYESETVSDRLKSIAFTYNNFVTKNRNFGTHEGKERIYNTIRFFLKNC